MMLPTYYKCKECECEFPHKDYDHDAGLCKNCLIIKKESVAKLHCSDGLVALIERWENVAEGLQETINEEADRLARVSFESTLKVMTKMIRQARELMGSN